jgi:hypothetical protein
MSFTVEILSENDVRAGRVALQNDLEARKVIDGEILHLDQESEYLRQQHADDGASAKDIIRMLIAKVKSQTRRDPSELELFTNGFALPDHLYLFVRDLPQTYIRFICPYAVVSLKDLAELPFQNETNYCFVIADFSVTQIEDCCKLITDAAYQRFLVHIDWLGIRNPVDIDRFKYILTHGKWPIIRSLNICGGVTNVNVQCLVETIFNVVSLKITTPETLRLEYFLGFLQLASLSISGPVGVLWSEEEWEHTGKWGLKELELRNCTQLTSFHFLTSLLKVTLLHLYFSEALNANEELNNLFSTCYKTLGTLNLSYTSAVTDDLLRALKVSNVVLVVLRVNCGSRSFGFTDAVLKTYLEWPENRKLRTVELYGHLQLTKEIFNCIPACRSSLEQLDVRETGCFGENHDEVLDQVFKFGMEASSGGSGIAGLNATPQGHTSEALHIHFSYQSTITAASQRHCPPGGSDRNSNRKRIVVRYWKKIDTGMPEATPRKTPTTSSSSPSQSTHEDEDICVPRENVEKTRTVKFDVPEKMLRQGKYIRWNETVKHVVSSSDTAPSDLSLGSDSVFGDDTRSQAAQLTTDQPVVSLSTSSTAGSPTENRILQLKPFGELSASGTTGTAAPVVTSSALVIKPSRHVQEKPTGPQDASISLDRSPEGHRPKFTRLSDPQRQRDTKTRDYIVRSGSMSDAEGTSGSVAVLLPVDPARNRLLSSSHFQPVQSCPVDPNVKISPSASSDSSSQFADVSSLGSSSPSDGGWDSSLLGPKVLSSSRLSLYAFPHTSVESISSNLAVTMDEQTHPTTSGDVDTDKTLTIEHAKIDQSNPGTSQEKPLLDQLMHDTVEATKPLAASSAESTPSQSSFAKFCSQMVDRAGGSSTDITGKTDRMFGIDTPCFSGAGSSSLVL